MIMVVMTFKVPLVHAAPLSHGIIMHSIRLVYPENAANGVGMEIENMTANNYLVQSWARPYSVNDEAGMSEKQGENNGFIILPLLKRFERGERLNLLVKRVGGSFPENKESVFYVSVKFIPSTAQSDDNKETVNVNVILVNNIKVFYRPSSVPEVDTVKNSKNLRYRIEGKNLIVDNPTPYFITYHSLICGDSVIDKAQLRKMVPPLGSQTYKLSNESQSKDVRFSVINDIGTASKEIVNKAD